MTYQARPTVVATLVALAALAPAIPARATDPVSSSLIVSSALVLISPVTGLISLAFDIARFFGDYEENKVMVRPSRYEDQWKYSYRGTTSTRTRTEWLSGNHGPFFRTDEVLRRPDGTVTYHTDSNPFPHALEQRTYSCYTSAGMNQEISSSLKLELGYEVVRPATLRYFTGPDPLPVTVRWDVHYLTESCLDEPKGGQSITRDRFAPRNSWAPLSLPTSKSMEILAIQLAPRS